MQSVTIQWTNIREYIAEVATKDMREAMKLTADEGAKYLKNISPQNKRRSARRGKYAKGWRSSAVEGIGRTGDVYIYNATDWQLTHLLEDGHNVKNRFSKGKVVGWANGDGHISKAEGYVYGILDRRLRISRGLY